MTSDRLRSWLLTPPSLAGVIDPFAVVYGIVFLAGFLLSAYVAGTGALPAPARQAGSRRTQRWARVGMGIFGTGLVFLGARLLQINPLGFGAPIWMVAATLALVGAAARFLRSWRTTAATVAPGPADQPLERAEARST